MSSTGSRPNARRRNRWSARFASPRSDRLKLVDHRNDGDARHKKLVDLGDEIEISLIEAERDFINDLYRDGELKDEQRRHIERELDLRDAHLANVPALDGKTAWAPSRQAPA